jgi:gliding motility-associated protein GldC
MKTSEINFKIELDEKNIPERIFWDASENPAGSAQETKAIALALWDHVNKGTMKIDLWAKDMPVGEMKRFYIETIGSMGESLLNATGDQAMFEEIREFCSKLAEKVAKEENSGK